MKIHSRSSLVVTCTLALAMFGCASSPTAPTQSDALDESGQTSFLESLGHRISRAGSGIGAALSKVFDRDLHSANLGPATACDSKSGVSQLVVESASVDPAVTQADGEFRHTVVVHLCMAPQSAAELSHALNIRHKGAVVHQGKAFVTRNVQRARLALYTVVDVSPKAPAGPYVAESVVTLGSKTYRTKSPFFVSAPK